MPSRSTRILAAEDVAAARIGYRTYDAALMAWAESVGDPAAVRVAAAEYLKCRPGRLPISAEEGRALALWNRRQPGKWVNVNASVLLDAWLGETEWGQR